MRHPTWQYIIDWTVIMARKYGGTVYEHDGKQWDWGQALCRETYGRDWMKNAEFIQNEEIPPENAAPEKFVSDAKKWELGINPIWVDTSCFKVTKPCEFVELKEDGNICRYDDQCDYQMFGDDTDPTFCMKEEIKEFEKNNPKGYEVIK